MVQSTVVPVRLYSYRVSWYSRIVVVTSNGGGGGGGGGGAAPSRRGTTTSSSSSSDSTSVSLRALLRVRLIVLSRGF